LTLDAFGSIGLGVELGSLTQSNNQFIRDYDWTINEIELRFQFPYRLHTQLEYNRVRLRINQYVNSIIEERRKTDYQDKSDLVSLLLRSGQNNEFIRDSVINFLIAGRDTTASLLTWTVYYLSMYPDIKEKLIQEIDEHLGKREPTFDDIKNFKYMNNVLNEVLRLNPPALPVTSKQSISDDTLPNGIKVKAGQIILYSPYVMHRIHWGKDSEEFRPERWNGDDPVPKKNPYAFVPFQRGPRQCLGINMAYEEATIMLILLLQSGFNLKVQPGQTITHKKGIPVIFTCRYGLNVKVQ